MREIIFRAKRKDNGEWVEGYYQKRFDLDESEQHLIFWSKNYTVWEYVEVNPDTLCQYTGLKDKNGRKIFENDILDCGMNLRVSWHTFKASWVLSKKGWMYKRYFGESVEPEDVEVVGNIFDNPEL